MNILSEKSHTSRLFRIFKDSLRLVIVLALSYVALFNQYVRPYIKDNITDYKIIKREKMLLYGISGHTFVEIRDDKDNVIGQMHGFPSDESGILKEIGDKSNYKLKVFELDYDRYSKDNYKIGYVLFSGSKEEVMNKWENAKICAKQINDKDLYYPIWGFKIFSKTYNSNSVADTLISCMGLENKNIGLFTPGKNNNLLSN